MKIKITHIACWLFLWLSLSSEANTNLKIAVASNFAPTMKAIVEHYHQKYFNNPQIKKPVLIIGSSGKHFAQIINGAPYDLFFSADQNKPQSLVAKGIISKTQTLTYAIGKLVLWKKTSTSNASILQQLTQQLQEKEPILTIANPKLAPYGLAAKQTLTKLKLWKKYHKKIILGENISQSFHFTNLGAVPYGFIAYSQWLHLQESDNSNEKANHWLVPQHYYSPIKQEAAILKISPASQHFIRYFQSPEIKRLINQHGYQTI
jgi:molybdate transport system substrate-binding protein